MKCLVCVPAFTSHVFRWLGHATFLHHCLLGLDAVRGIDKIVCVCLKTGFDDATNVLRRLPNMNVTLVEAETQKKNAKTSPEAASLLAMGDLVNDYDSIAFRYPSTPFITSAVVETCINKVEGPGHNCWTVREQEVLRFEGAAVKAPGMVLVRGVWIYARAPGTFRGSVVPVSGIEAVDIEESDGFRLAQNLEDFGTV